MDSFKTIHFLFFRLLLRGSFLRKDRGLTIIYVLFSLILISFIGIGLIKMASHDIRAAGDFNAMRSAEVAAHSGLQACVEKFQKNGPACLNCLNKYRNGTGDGWIFGGTSSWYTLNGEQKFRAQITGFDVSNKAILIKGEGLGKDGSKRTATGMYKLDGIKLDTTIIQGGRKAMYFATGWELDKKFTLDGCYYCEGSTVFTSYCGGSIFNGPVIIKGNAEFHGAYTFNDVAYFGNNFLTLTGTVAPKRGMVFNKKSGFQGTFDVTPTDTIQIIDMYADTYFNGGFTSDGKIDDLHGHDFYHDGGANPTGHISNYNKIIPKSPSINLAAELSITTTMPVPQFHEDAITPSSLIKSVSPTTISGTWANNIYNNPTSYPRWNGFAVVRILSTASPYITRAATFTGKIIIINEGMIHYTSVGGDEGWYNCAAGSITVIYNKNKLRWGQNTGYTDTYRGYIYNEGSDFYLGFASGVRVREIIGAVHDRSTTPLMPYFYGADVNCHIQFSDPIMNELEHINLVSNVTAIGDTTFTDTLILTNPSLGIQSTLLGMSF